MLLKPINAADNTTKSGLITPLAGLTGRRPWNRSVDVFGDSIGYGNSFSTGGSIKLYGKGMIPWAACFGRQRWHFEHAGNYGWPGRSTREALDPAQGINGNYPVANVSPIDIYVANNSSSSVVILDILTNDEANGVPLAESKTNYLLLLNKLLAMGKIVIVVTPRPRDITASGLTLSQLQYRQLMARRDFVLGLHNPGQGVYALDLWRALADPTSANGAMKINYTYDGLHPGLLGGFYSGKELARLFGDGYGPGLFDYIDVMVGSNLDVYAADYPRGCLNSNPMLAGGTTAATGYTVGNGSGVIGTGSKVTTSDGRTDVQQVTFSGTATANGDVYDCYQTISAAKLEIGDQVRAFADVEYDAISGMSAHGLFLVDTSDFNKNAGFLVDSTDINTQAATVVPTIPAFTGVMRTPLLTLAATTLRAGMKGRAVNTRAVTGSYRIRSLMVRKLVA